MSQVVKVVAALGVFFGYPIQFFVMMKILWPPVKRGYGCAQKYPITIQVILRFIMVMLTCKYTLTDNRFNCNNCFLCRSLRRPGGASTELVHLPHWRTVLHIAGICHTGASRFRYSRPGAQGPGHIYLSEKYLHSDYRRAGNCHGYLSEHCRNYKRV